MRRRGWSRIISGGGGGDNTAPAREGQRPAAGPNREARGRPGRAWEAGQEEAREADPGPGLDGVSLISYLRLDFLSQSRLLFAYTAFFFRSPITLARAAAEAAAAKGAAFRRSRSDHASLAKEGGRGDSDLGLDPDDA